MNITHTNIQRFDNIPFEDYLKFGGFSHSFLKRERGGITEEFVMTDKVMIGKLVDGIITEPGEVDMSHKLYPIAKRIAFDINNTFGDLISSFVSQVSYKAEVNFNGFVMPTTGRLDFLLPGHAVIDLKVTFEKVGSLEGLIEFMGYKNQLWNYCKMAQVDKAYLMFHSVKSKKTIIKFIDCSNGYNDFWADKTMLFGKVLA